MDQGPLDGVRVIQRGGLEEERVAVHAIHMNAVCHEVVDLAEQAKFVDELPVPSEPAIGRISKNTGSLVGEVSLRVEQADAPRATCVSHV
jgi:hypothetical protein